MGAQIQALRRGADIVVATPGRLSTTCSATIDLSAVEILTLDEADRMLDMGFLPPLRRVIPALPPTRQTLMFSATFSPEVDPPRGRLHARPRTCGRVGRPGRRAHGDAPRASGDPGPEEATC